MPKCRSPIQNNSIMTYDSTSLRLPDDALIDELGTLTLDDLPDRNPLCPLRLNSPTPLLAKLWTCALYDAESNLVEHPMGGRYFTAGGRGKGFASMIFTRDNGYAGILGLNRIFPAEMKEAVETTRRVRLQLGLRVDRDQFHPDLPFEKEDISEAEFKTKYLTNSFIRRTDDVLWLWWAEDLFAEHFDQPENWQWLLETGQRCFDELYQPFYDSRDGLYFGQSSFIDIGFNGYPAEFGLRTVESKYRALRIKAASTNALYYQGMRVMERTANRLGHAVVAERWRSRAEEIRRAFRSRLIAPDGTISYFAHGDKQLEQREHALATAFPILFDLLDAEESRAAIQRYPVTWWGVPLIHPFYPSDHIYHNQSAWPFADAFFLRAREKALGVDETGRELALLARSCRGDTFHEWTSAFDKLPKGVPATLWTLGAFVGRCVRAGWLNKS